MNEYLIVLRGGAGTPHAANIQPFLVLSASKDEAVVAAMAHKSVVVDPEILIAETLKAPSGLVLEPNKALLWIPEK